MGTASSCLTRSSRLICVRVQDWQAYWGPSRNSGAVEFEFTVVPNRIKKDGGTQVRIQKWLAPCIL